MNREFIMLPQTGSTNDDLKDMIYRSDDRVFSVVSSAKQTGGKGRLGKSFFSPDGGLYFSVSYPLDGGEKHISFLTLLAGLCVSEELDGLCDIKTQIKWPNDIYLNEKKLCGILCELIGDRQNLTAIVGIGINLGIKKEDFPPELRDRMTSLAAENILLPDKTKLIKNITARLDRAVYKEKELYTVNTQTVAKIEKRSYSIGRRACVDSVGFDADGVVVGIDTDGAVKIKLDGGGLIRKI